MRWCFLLVTLVAVFVVFDDVLDMEQQGLVLRVFWKPIGSSEVLRYFVRLGLLAKRAYEATEA